MYRTAIVGLSAIFETDLKVFALGILKILRKFQGKTCYTVKNSIWRNLM